LISLISARAAGVATSNAAAINIVHRAAAPRAPVLSGIVSSS
jgi:hypothetical protein